MTKEPVVNKKDHIMDVAEKLFSENGFEGTSTRMIASAATVNLAMVSYYFGGKEQLFQEMMERKMTHVRVVLTNLLEEKTTSWEKMERFIDLQVERMFTNRQFGCIIHRELSMNNRGLLTGTIIDAISKNHLLVAEIIMQGQKSKEFKKDIDTPMIMASIYGTIQQIVYSPVLSARLMGIDPSSDEMWNEKNRKRVKMHLKNLIKPALMNAVKP